MTFESRLRQIQVTSTCPDCGTVGTTMMPKCFANEARRCDDCVRRCIATDDKRRLIDFRRNAVRLAGIPDRYLVWDETIARQIGSDLLLTWILEHAEGSMWIAGANGAGKTHAVHYAAFRRIVDCEDSVRSLRCSDFLLKVVQLRQGKYDDVEVSQKLVKDALDTGILILDDLGKEKLSLSKAEILWELIDLRERDSKRIWITTNLSGSELELRLGDHGPAIMERLRRAAPEANRWPVTQERRTTPDDLFE